ncbi:hypothetical protein HMPREF9566_02097 [Cutibacterium acnes HL045PA1]|nr:hypothetical protein HMPREF9604_01985 [Cutibacterium acnes HL036PA1]EFS68108.1 hypothetical protein HMPREF9616_02091 [Cutibacterium acnes HL007PA1]EFT20170.1 hypothetical protein HMPREF9566_02097 [Cutibacterium acnes HL045PA1]
MISNKAIYHLSPPTRPAWQLEILPSVLNSRRRRAHRFTAILQAN